MPFIEITSRVNVDLDMLATCFTNMDDDAQAKFFVKVAELAKTWKDPGAQWYAIGSHLRNCKCSNEEARDMIRSIAWAVENGKHGQEQAA